LTVRKEVEEVLRSLTVEELVEARRHIDRLLAELEQSEALARRAPAETSEQRQFERYSINLPVTYFRHAEPAVEDALVRDIARGGVRFFTREKLEPEEILTLYLPAQLGARKLLVEVRWVTPHGGQYECGASYVGLARVFAAQKAEQERSRAAEILVAWKPCPEREALADLLAKDGHSVDMANSVPEAVARLGRGAGGMVLATAAMLKAENQRLLKAVEARAGEILSVALIEPSELDDPSNAALLRCHDYIARPDRVQEVRVIVGRVHQRVVAARARRALA
jgi:CheY-like chemotaxis protein